MAVVITAQSSIAPGGSLRRTAGTPAWWLRSCRTVTDSLPPAPNSGQYLATGASVSSRPVPASLAASTDISPLPTEKKLTSVSGRHGVTLAAVAQPPHRSATTRPPAVTQMAAPVSPRAAKFSANARRTGSKLASQVPSIMAWPTARRHSPQASRCSPGSQG